MSTRPSTIATFAGFERAAPGFFHELALEMNRDWFMANKHRYEAQWVAPMTVLLASIGARLAKVYAPIKLGPPKLLRIYRDVRFSNDKQPYKTHIAGVIRTLGAAAGECAALYLELGADEEYAGVGSYFFADRKLTTWRKRVDNARTGNQLAELVARLRNTGYAVNGHDSYKRVPRPYSDDHPRAGLLKLRGLTAAFPEIPRGSCTDPSSTGWSSTARPPRRW